MKTLTTQGVLGGNTTTTKQGYFMDGIEPPPGNKANLY